MNIIRKKKKKKKKKMKIIVVRIAAPVVHRAEAGSFLLGPVDFRKLATQRAGGIFRELAGFYFFGALC